MLRFKNVLNLNCWLSDFHNFISVITKWHVSRRIPKVIQCRSMKNFQDEPFISDLYVLSNAVPYGLNDVNVCTSALIQHLYSIIESHAPTKRRTIRHNDVPFMNSLLRKLQRERNQARNIKTKFATAENHEKYRILRNKCVKLRLSSQRKYFSERCEGGPKNQSFWPTIKPFLTNRNQSNGNIMLCDNDEIITDSISVANIFNIYFMDVLEQRVLYSYRKHPKERATVCYKCLYVKFPRIT